MPDGFELVTRLRYAVGLGLSLALSITITRRISIFILQLPAKRSMSAAAFSLLLLVHLLLLVVWYPIYVAAVTFLEIFFDTAQRVIFNRHPFPDHITIILDDRPRVATTANDFLWLFWKQEFHSWLGFIEDVLQGKSPLLTPFSRWMDACAASDVTTEAWHRIEICMETSADSAIHVARIAFALIFLLACLLVPPLKDIVVKLVRQPKPIVPIVLGSMTVGAMLIKKGLSFI